MEIRVALQNMVKRPAKVGRADESRKTCWSTSIPQASFYTLFMRYRMRCPMSFSMLYSYHSPWIPRVLQGSLGHSVFWIACYRFPVAEQE